MAKEKPQTRINKFIPTSEQKFGKHYFPNIIAIKDYAIPSVKVDWKKFRLK